MGAKFHHIDFMAESAEDELGSLLEKTGEATEKTFDIVFCFSVTMWIHLVSWRRMKRRVSVNLCNTVETGYKVTAYKVNLAIKSLHQSPSMPLESQE